MTKTTIMTAEQAFNLSMNVYPSLYHANTIQQAQFKFFDHMFNVIGNGYRNHQEFIDAHTINNKNKKFLASFPEKYIGEIPLHHCYTKMQNIGNLKLPDLHSALKELLTIEEIKERTDIVYFNQCANQKNKQDKEAPYPNFKKEYSLLWNVHLKDLDQSWIEAGINYYTQMKTFFDSEQIDLYSSAIPKDPNKLQNLINQYETHFKHRKTENMTNQEHFDKISNDYECKYEGNTEQFIHQRWNKELLRIKDFINETLHYLEQNLTSNKK